MVKAQTKIGVGLVVAAAFFAIAFVGASQGSFFGVSTAYGYNEDKPTKVEICHKGKTISISSSAVQAHVKHGDTEDACEDIPDMPDFPEDPGGPIV